MLRRPGSTTPNEPHWNRRHCSRGFNLVLTYQDKHCGGRRATAPDLMGVADAHHPLQVGNKHQISIHSGTRVMEQRGNLDVQGRVGRGGPAEVRRSESSRGGE